MNLIDELIQNGYLKTPSVINAFRKINRADFIRQEDKNYAEINAPLSIGYGQTISQPLTVAFMLELLQPKPGEKILDVGSGSGWTIALLAEIVGSTGHVYGIERIPQLAEFANANVSKYDFIKNSTVQIFCSDGYIGLPEYAPFDKIIVAAAADNIPQELVKQLKVGGKLVMPIGETGGSQAIVSFKKIGPMKYDKKIYPGFVFVPLVKPRDGRN